MNKTKKIEVDGLVWIKNKIVHVQNENKLKDGLPALINPCEGVKLIINNLECHHLTSVSESDDIKIIELESTQNAQMDIIVTNDDMAVYFDYHPQCKIKYELKDAEPANKIDLEADFVVLETLPFNKDVLYNLFKKLGITHGIKESIIDEIVEKNIPDKYLIAEGIKVIEPLNESIEYLFNDDEEKELNLKENEFGNVDFKNIFDYNDVKIGETIAKIIPPTYGSKGKTVFGKEINVREPKMLNIVDTAYALYDKSKKVIIAKKSGRPTKIARNNIIMFTIVDRISIDNVNVETGNIRFNGDVEIKEYVADSMEVISRKNIYINKGCLFSTIQSGNNIEIKESIISSHIFAAKNISFGQNPTSEIQRALEQLNQLIYNIENFNNVTDQKKDNFHEKIYYLLNNNNKKLTQVIYEIIRNFKKGIYDIEKDDLLTFIKNTKVLLGNFLEIENIEHLKNIANTLNLMCIVSDNSTITGNVKIGYALNSTIHALGDVHILGKGASTSKIYSDGNVFVSGNFRGGEIHAKKNVEINSTGVESGVYTLISVPIGYTIKIRTAYPETTIKFGVYTHKFFETKKNVVAKVKDKRILFL